MCKGTVNLDRFKLIWIGLNRFAVCKQGLSDPREAIGLVCKQCLGEAFT